jgi:O-acetyl-ADP-ribose deacetylase (regulator of RNase III)
LESCYRRSLEVADELGARSVAFPLISAGIYGWPQRDAIAAAIQTIAGADTRVEDVRLVCFGQSVYEAVLEQLAAWAPNQTATP